MADDGTILWPGDEGYDEATAAAGWTGGSALGGGEAADMSQIMADPRLSSAYQTITGARGYPPQPSAAMGGFGDLRGRGGAGIESMVGGAVPGSVPSGGVGSAGPGIAPPAVLAKCQWLEDRGRDVEKLEKLWRQVRQ